MTFPVLNPCSKTWQSLQGEGPRKFRPDCNLHIHNFANLAPAKVQTLLNSGQRLCGIENIPPSRGFLAAALVIVGSLSLFSQQPASLKVAVFDPTGASISNAKIIVKIPGDSAPPTVLTGPNGVADLVFNWKPGTEIQVQVPGLHTERKLLTRLSAGTLEIVLHFGSVGGNESVGTAKLAAINTQSFFRRLFTHPCHVTWDSLAGDGLARHCDACDTTVHDLSAVNPQSLRKRLRQGENLCGIERRAVLTAIVLAPSRCPQPDPSASKSSMRPAPLSTPGLFPQPRPIAAKPSRRAPTNWAWPTSTSTGSPAWSSTFNAPVSTLGSTSRNPRRPERSASPFRLEANAPEWASSSKPVATSPRLVLSSKS